MDAIFYITIIFIFAAALTGIFVDRRKVSQAPVASAPIRPASSSTISMGLAAPWSDWANSTHKLPAEIAKNDAVPRSQAALHRTHLGTTL